MTSPLEVVLEFFRAEKWKISSTPVSPLITTSYTGLNGQWFCVAQVGQQPTRFVFYSMCPVIIPQPKRAAVAEFLTRANYGGVIGNFEMEWGAGEVRYRTSLEAGNSELTPSLIRPLVHLNIIMMDNYLPGLLAVTFGNISPKVAIQQAEAVAPSPLAA